MQLPNLLGVDLDAISDEQIAELFVSLQAGPWRELELLQQLRQQTIARFLQEENVDHGQLERLDQQFQDMIQQCIEAIQRDMTAIIGQYLSVTEIRAFLKFSQEFPDFELSRLNFITASASLCLTQSTTTLLNMQRSAEDWIDQMFGDDPYDLEGFFEEHDPHPKMN